MQAVAVLSPVTNVTKLDPAGDVRARWYASYRQRRAMIRDRRTSTVGTAYTWTIGHLRRRFGASGFALAQRAALLVLDRRCPLHGASGTLDDLRRQGLVDRKGQPLRCSRVETVSTFRMAWGSDPLIVVNSRRGLRRQRAAESAGERRRRIAVAVAMAEDRLALGETRFAITPAGIAALRAAEAAVTA